MSDNNTIETINTNIAAALAAKISSLPYTDPTDPRCWRETTPPHPTRHFPPVAPRCHPIGYGA